MGTTKQEVEDTSLAELSNIVFSPPLYEQRYQQVVKIIQQYQPRKVVDVGCGELSIIRLLKFHESIHELIGVDIDADVMRHRVSVIKPILDCYLNPLSHPFTISLLHGSITEEDSRLLGTDMVVCVEVIEHLYPDDLEKATEVLFGFMQPTRAVFTTPNAEFNILFPGFTGFRHDDHKFEWTRQEFQQWGDSVCLRYGYTVEYSGIGAGPPDSEHLGCCTQMAFFQRINPVTTRKKADDHPLVYEEIAREEYPCRQPSKDIKKSIIYEVQYHIRQLLMGARLDLNDGQGQYDDISDDERDDGMNQWVNGRLGGGAVSERETSGKISSQTVIGIVSGAVSERKIDENNQTRSIIAPVTAAVCEKELRVNNLTQLRKDSGAEEGIIIQHHSHDVPGKDYQGITKGTLDSKMDGEVQEQQSVSDIHNCQCEVVENGPHQKGCNEIGEIVVTGGESGVDGRMQNKIGAKHQTGYNHLAKNDCSASMNNESINGVEGMHTGNFNAKTSNICCNCLEQRKSTTSISNLPNSEVNAMTSLNLDMHCTKHSNEICCVGTSKHVKDHQVIKHGLENGVCSANAEGCYSDCYSGDWEAQDHYDGGVKSEAEGYIIDIEDCPRFLQNEARDFRPHVDDVVNGMSFFSQWEQGFPYVRDWIVEELKVRIPLNRLLKLPSLQRLCPTTEELGAVLSTSGQFLLSADQTAIICDLYEDDDRHSGLYTLDGDSDDRDIEGVDDEDNMLVQLGGLENCKEESWDRVRFVNPS